LRRQNIPVMPQIIELSCSGEWQSKIKPGTGQSVSSRSRISRIAKMFTHDCEAKQAYSIVQE